MKKPKVEIGQCYEDKYKYIWMVTKGPFFGWNRKYWEIENTLMRAKGSVVESAIIKWRRPFENYG